MNTKIDPKTILFVATLLVLGLAGFLYRDTSASERADAGSEATASTQGWDVHSGSPVVAEDTAHQLSQEESGFLSMQRVLGDSNRTYSLHLVPSRDELLIPVGVRRPDGPGPFPIILMGSGNGRGAFARIDDAMYRLEPMMDMMLSRGYAVAFGNYRHEIPFQYNQTERCENIPDDISGGARALKSTPCLDSDDYVELIEHLKTLSYVDADRVGTIGVSHNGELQMKAAAYIRWGAAVAIEGASHEFLAVDTNAAPRRNDGRLLWLPDVESTLPYTDLDLARSRVARIQTPFLHIGRDQDHLQGIFLLSYQLSEAAGKDAEWFSYAHDVHGFGFLYRNDDGSFTPDDVQLEAFEMWMGYFDRYLGGNGTP